MGADFQIDKLLEFITSRLDTIEQDIKKLSDKFDQKWDKEVRKRFHDLRDGILSKLQYKLNDLDDRLMLFEQSNNYRKKGISFFFKTFFAFCFAIGGIVLDRLWKN